jgi:hypothetical protein
MKIAIPTRFPVSASFLTGRRKSHLVRIPHALVEAAMIESPARAGSDWSTVTAMAKKGSSRLTDMRDLALADSCLGQLGRTT